MKHLSFCISFLLLLVLAACSDDKHPEEEGAWWYPRYFEGDLNNKSVSIDDSSPGSSIIASYAEHSGEYEDENYTLLNPPEKSYGIHIPLTGIIAVPFAEDKEISLNISLSPLREGTYTIQCDGPALGLSSVYIKSDEEALIPQVEYFPSKEPLKLEVTRIEYPNLGGVPIVEGWLEGVLYRRDNPQDFIMIKNAVFGAHKSAL